MKEALLAIFCLISTVPLSITQGQYGVPADLALFASPDSPANFVYKGLQFHSDQKVDGVIAPIAVNGRNGRSINSYAYSYKSANINTINSAGAIPSGDVGPFIEAELQVGIGVNQGWKRTTNAQQGKYTSENSLDVNTTAIIIGEIEPTPLTKMLEAKGLLEQNNAPVSISDIRSQENLTYSGKEINDIEGSSSFIAPARRGLLDNSQLQSANAKFLYNKELTKDGIGHLQSGIFLTTDSLMWPSYAIASLASSLDDNISSRGTGVADISYAQSKTVDSAQKHPFPEYEGRDRYVGDFEINRKLHMNSIISDWSIGVGAGNYDWLPCTCQRGWDDMDLHDQRYHSAKGFFDCTACPTPYCPSK